MDSQPFLSEAKESLLLEIKTMLNALEESVVKLEKYNITNQLIYCNSLIYSSKKEMQQVALKIEELSLYTDTIYIEEMRNSKRKCTLLEKRFQTVSKEIIDKLKKTTESTVKNTDNNTMDAQTQVLEEQSAKHLSKYLEERQTDINNIESTLIDVHNIAVRMNGVMIENGNKIDNLSQNIQRAEKQIKNGIDQLKITEKKTDKFGARSTWLIICSVILVVLIIAFLN